MFFDIRKICSFILDIIFPKICIGCGKEEIYVCESCLSKIPISGNLYCYICNRRTSDGKIHPWCKKKNRSPLSGILIASDWQSPLLRQIIYEYKYRFAYELSKPLGKILVRFLKENIGVLPLGRDIGVPPLGEDQSSLKRGTPILIPIPLHRRRQAWRGFNQAEVLAKEIGTQLNILVETTILKRARHTQPQMDIKDQKERKKNIQAAFSLRQLSTPNLQHSTGVLSLDRDTGVPLLGEEKNLRIILIDDVCTTGATLEEAARALKPLKPKEIWGLVLARG